MSLTFDWGWAGTPGAWAGSLGEAMENDFNFFKIKPLASLAFPTKLIREMAAKEESLGRARSIFESWSWYSLRSSAVRSNLAK